MRSWLLAFIIVLYGLVSFNTEAMARGAMTPVVEDLRNGVKVIFPWKDDVGATVFIRGDRLWMVFDKHSDIKIDSLRKIQYLSSIEILPHADASIITAKVEELDINISVSKHDKKWVVELSGYKKKDTNRDLVVISKPYAAPFPYIAVKIAEMGQEIIYIKDKVYRG